MMSAIDKLLRQKGATKSASAAPMDDLVTVSKARDAVVTGESAGANEDGEGRTQRAAQSDSSDDDDDDEREVDVDDVSGGAKKRQSDTYDEESESEAEAPTQPVEVEETFAQLAENIPQIRKVKNIKNYTWMAEGEACCAAFDLVYSAAMHKFLLLDVIERIAGDVVIRHIPGLQRAHLMPPEQAGQPYTISTEGINFAGILDAIPLESIDHTATTCNSIHAILHTYGVEAARAAIVNEISAVFAVYGISIDSRHMSLIADYMTQEGGYRAFNRSGMENVASPFLKMTFETTVQYLKNATLIGETDELISPAARIVMGQPVALGTGSFEIRAPIA